jgi:hypothetical protein
MKNNTCKILLLSITVAWSSYGQNSNPSIELVRETLLTSFLAPCVYSSADCDKSHPITIDKNVPQGVRRGGPKGGIEYPLKWINPLTVRYAFYIGIDSTAVYDALSSNRSKTLFGQDIIKDKIKMAQKDYNGQNMEWINYKAAGVQAIFDKLYVKPEGKIKGYLSQEIYNTVARDYVRDITRVVVKAMTRKPEFENYAKQYLQQAINKADFNGLEFIYATGEKLLTDLKWQSDSGWAMYPDQYIVLGILLRRQADGSLPVLLKCLKTLLKDYDTEFYNQVSSKF